MKKLVLMFVAMAAISFASCDNKAKKVDTPADTAAVVDTTAKADTTVKADSVKADSAKVEVKK